MKEFSQRKNLEPDDFYYSAEGYIVFTEKYLFREVLNFILQQLRL